nr:hypothetical protein [Tanacetum cinerariifolium]
KSPVESLTRYRNLSAEFEDFFDDNIIEVNAADSPVLAVGQISTNITNTFSSAGHLNVVVSPTHRKSSCIDTSQYPDDSNMPELEDITHIPTARVPKDHPMTQIIVDLSLATQTRSMSRVAQDQGGLSQINNDDFHTCMFACFLSQEEPERVHQALKDPSWIEAMHKELLQFKMQKVWVLVDLPHRKRAVGTKWVFRNKKDKRGIVVRNKAQLVAQGHTQEEGIYYNEVFAPFARIEAIRLSLAYASFMGFMPIGFKDPDYPDKVYKVVKALYGLHQAPRACLTDGKSASTPIDTEKPLHKDPDDKRIFRYLKGKPHLGMWYPKDSPFNLVAYSDSDNAGASLDRKSTTGECQFLGYASEGFNQIIDFLNASSIKYALTVNHNIYVSCIKQFWTFVSVKTVNDVPRLQALVDKKKVITTEATIRDALRLDDAAGIDCLPNKEIFTELARMGYEKPSTKLAFYKAFFSSRKFNFSKTQVGDLSLHTTKYSSPALTHKPFTNMRRVGKGCSGVETQLFEGMIVAPQASEGAAEVHIDDVLATGVIDKGDADVNDVSAAIDEPSIPSPTPPTQPPPSQDQPSTSQVQPTPSPSLIVQPPLPQQQPQPLHDAQISLDLLHNLLETCTTLTIRVKHLEQDKIAQALEITKLKQRVKKLERRNKLKVSKLRRLKRARTVHRVDTFDDTVMHDISKQGRIISYIDADVDVTLKDVLVDTETEESADVLSMQDDDIEPTKLQEVVEVVTTAKLITKVVTAASATITVVAPQLTTAAAPTLTTAPSAARRRKGVDEAYARELEVELNKNIDWDEVIDQVKRKEKEDNVVMRYQALKRKPQTETQARKNMMIYLRNVVGFKMDYFKGMTYNDIRPIFEKNFNSNVAFLQKSKEQMEEEDNKALKRISESQEDKVAKKQKLDEEVVELKRHLQIVPNDDDDVYTEATPLARMVHVVDYEIITENNEPYYKMIRADGSPQLFFSFLSLLRNFDREDLEVLWELVKESSSMEESKNSSWFSKGQKLETVRVLGSAHYHIYFYTYDLASREKISTYKVHSGSNA